MTASAFRLAQRSTRRRRLLLLDPFRGNQVPSVPNPAANAPTAVGVHHAPTAIGRPTQQPRPSFASNCSVSGALPLPLDVDRPLTWVFAGDALVAGATSEQSCFAPLVSSLVEALQAGRQKDRFIEALAPGISIPHLVSSWETRIAVHRPDVLVMMCGNSDAVSGMRGLRSFEDALVKLLVACRWAGIHPIINTPPCQLESNSSRLADMQIYLEALRAEAKSHNATLVDHWGHWEWAAAEMGHTDIWYDETGLFPSPAGHRQMVRTFLQAVGSRQQPEPSNC